MAGVALEGGINLEKEAELAKNARKCHHEARQPAPACVASSKGIPSRCAHGGANASFGGVEEQQSNDDEGTGRGVKRTANRRMVLIANWSISP